MCETRHDVVYGGGDGKVGKERGVGGCAEVSNLSVWLNLNNFQERKIA
jgi:hypothetical protein